MASKNSGKVVQMNEHASFTRRFRPADAARLLRDCMDAALERSAATVARALDNVDDALFALADKADTNTRQGRYFDAMREIRINRQKIEESFKAYFTTDRANQGSSPEPAESSIANVKEIGLCLVENDDLEESLAITTLTDKLKALCHGELFALDKRIGFLLDKDELDSKDNPLGPKALCTAFKIACGNIESGIDIKIIVFKLFDKYMCENIQALYRDLNDYLAKNGVLPKIAARIENGTDMSRIPPSGEPDFLMAFTQLMTAANPQSNGSAYIAPPRDGATDMLRNLTLLQRGQWDTLGLQPTAIDSAALVNGTANILRIIKDSSIAEELGGGDNMVMEVVALLFDYIFDNQNIPDKAKALIGRLQIPVLKVAMLDKSFFSKRHHPARRLLNTLAQATIGLHNEQAGESDLYMQLESCVQKVQTEFETDVDVFESAQQDLETYLDKQQVHLDEHIEEAKKVIQGRERLKIAESITEDEITKRLAGKPFPEFIRTFAIENWKNLLIVAYLKEGQESEVWKSRLEMLDLLIWSVLPKPTLKDKKKLVDMLPTLLSGIESGMKLLSLPEAEQNAFLEQLASCHARIVNSEAGAQDKALAIEEIVMLGQNSKPIPGQDNSSERLTVAIDPFGVAKTSAPTIIDDDEKGQEQAPIEDEYTAVVKNLVPGIWFEFHQEDNTRIMERLSWISAVLGTHLFTNHDGIKTREMTAKELEESLRNGHATLADDMNFLVDRSFNHLLDDLQKKAAG